MSGKMSFEDRWTRDGQRWRYIYHLERELENGKIYRSFLLFSAALNVLLLTLVIRWWVVA